MEYLSKCAGFSNWQKFKFLNIFWIFVPMCGTGRGHRPLNLRACLIWQFFLQLKSRNLAAMVIKCWKIIQFNSIIRKFLPILHERTRLELRMIWFLFLFQIRKRQIQNGMFYYESTIVGQKKTPDQKSMKFWILCLDMIDIFAP